MNYYLYRLSFSAPVHFGTGESAYSLESSEMTFCADTLFSALCLCADKCGVLDKIVGEVKADRLALSDAMPFYGGTLFLPKPMLPATTERNGDPSQRKKYKKLKYLPADNFASYIKSLGGADFDIDNAAYQFGENEIIGKVALRGEESEPYSVGAFRFAEGCGLYFIIGYEDVKIINIATELIGLLGAEGIGGKISAGFGKFTAERIEIASSSDNGCVKALHAFLCEKNADFYTALTSWANDGDCNDILDGAYYKLIRRGGFVNSAAFGRPYKKVSQYFFAAGSCFKKSFGGALFDVYGSDIQPVYRYAKPIYAGVKL